LFNKTQALTSYNIFPGAARDFENTFGAQTFMFGRYKAVLLASYGVNDNLPLTATLYFWVIPWRLILVIILIAIAVILGTIYFKKRKKVDPKTYEEVKEVNQEPETKEKTS
jgi:membrane protein implicated in regulation of membrane protease activity